MKVKTFEIRDRATFIPALAVKLNAEADSINDYYLLRRAGLDSPGSFDIYLAHLQTGKGCIDPYAWPDSGMVRTMPVAHAYIEKHFDELETGAVIDVQFILGETLSEKQSEKFTAFLMD